MTQFTDQQLPPGRILLSFTCVIAIRTFLEVFSRRRSLFLYDDFYRVVVYYLHAYLAWLSLFAAIALLIAFLMRLRYREGVLFTLLFSPLIMIVPLIDTILGRGRAGAVMYGETLDAFLYEFTHLLDPFATSAMVTTGVRVEVFLVVAGSLVFGLFVFKRGVLRSFGLALSIYSVIFLFGYLPAIYALSGWSPDNVQSLAATRLLAEQALFFLYLIPAGVIAVLTGILLAREEGGFRLSVLLIPAMGFVPIAFAVCSFFYTAYWLQLTDKIMSPGDLLKLGAVLLSLYLLFLAEERWVGNHAGEAAPIFLTLSALFGAAAAASFVLFWVLIASVIFLYDHRPFELRRIPVIRHLGEPLIAMAALLAGTSLILPYGPWRPFDGKGAVVVLLLLAVTATCVGVRHRKARSVKKQERGMEMTKKVLMSLVIVGVLSLGFAASAHALACKCEGLRVVNGGGIDWLDKKGGSCGANFMGGAKGTIKNDITDPFDFMSSKYYNDVLRGTVESAYDPDSGWRCVKRNTY